MRRYEDEIRSVEGPDARGAAPKEPPLTFRRDGRTYRVKPPF